MKHTAVQLSIIAEKVTESDVIELLEEAGAKGYTILEAGGNSPLHLHPAARTSVIDAFHIMKIEVIILDAAAADALAIKLMDELFLDRPGLVTISEVQVFRPQKF